MGTDKNKNFEYPPVIKYSPPMGKIFLLLQQSILSDKADKLKWRMIILGHFGSFTLLAGGKT